MLQLVAETQSLDTSRSAWQFMQRTMPAETHRLESETAR